METVNFLRDTWATDPVPLIIVAAGFIWLWNALPSDLMLAIVVGGGLWWWLA